MNSSTEKRVRLLRSRLAALACALLVAGWYWQQSGEFFFFKDDLINLYYRYQLGWESLWQPVFERGLAPLYRLEYMLVAPVSGPSWPLARLLVALWYLGIVLALCPLVWRLFGSLSSWPLVVLLLGFYPLHFGTVKWLPSALHLLPVIFLGVLLLNLVLLPGAKLATRLCGILAGSVLAYGFAPPEGLLLFASLGVALLYRQFMPAVGGGRLGLGLSALVGIGAGLLVASSYWLNWDVESTAILGEGKGEPLLLSAVFVKALLKYSLPGMLNGSVFYLESGWMLDAVALVYLGLVVRACLRGEVAGRVLLVAVASYVLFNYILILLFRADWFGWVIIPEHRYWLWPQLLFTLLALYVFHRFLLSRGAGVLFAPMLAALGLVLIYQSAQFRDRLYPAHNMAESRAYLQGVRQRLEKGEVNPAWCQSPLPESLQLVDSEMARHNLLARYYSASACDKPITRSQ